jgi:RNA polymerase sigma factor (sigma-70 family)
MPAPMQSVVSGSVAPRKYPSDGTTRSIRAATSSSSSCAGSPASANRSIAANALSAPAGLGDMGSTVHAEPGAVNPSIEGYADGYEHGLSTVETQQLLALLSGLSDRERSILRARYGLDGPEESLREIGARLGLSAERVRQLEHRALGKLAAAAGT